MYMAKYVYDGAVSSRGILIANRWSSETHAVSKAKAISNLKYQFNSATKSPSNRPLTFHGEVKEVS